MISKLEALKKMKAKGYHVAIDKGIVAIYVPSLSENIDKIRENLYAMDYHESFAVIERKNGNLPTFEENEQKDENEDFPEEEDDE